MNAITSIHRGFPLRAARLTAGLALLVQAAIISVVLIAFEERNTAALLPVVTTVGSATFPITDVNVGVGVTVPLVLGALLLLTGAASDRRLWWIETSLSASITVFLLAQLNGIHELGTLVAMYALTSAAVLFGALQESHASAMGRQPAIFGAMVGIVPWGLIAWYEIVPMAAGESGPAIWVRVLTLVMLGLFVAAAVLAWRRVGSGGAGFGIAISVVARSVPACAVAAGVAGGFTLT